LAEVNPKIEKGWLRALKTEFEKPYFAELKNFLKAEKAAGKVVYPPGSLIFHAFDTTPFNEVKVVILGQDPYHGPGQAHGLCFSVQHGVKPPPSLANIYKEMKTDLGMMPPNHGNLEKWANQGVLLLNSLLTVRANEPASHKGRGWETFTDAVIHTLNEQKEGIVFILWGKYAQDKGAAIDKHRHHVLAAAHPSPFSVERFYGCKHFSKTNALLKQMGQSPIDWKLD
jgi:uracil-DNA glycosylase